MIKIYWKIVSKHFLRKLLYIIYSIPAYLNVLTTYGKLKMKLMRPVKSQTGQPPIFFDILNHVEPMFLVILLWYYLHQHKQNSVRQMFPVCHILQDLKTPSATAKPPSIQQKTETSLSHSKYLHDNNLTICLILKLYH